MANIQPYKPNTQQATSPMASNFAGRAHEGSHREFRSEKILDYTNYKCLLEKGRTLQFGEITNFNRGLSPSTGYSSNQNRCVMCGVTDAAIPTQNKNVCKSCDSVPWLVKSPEVVVKFCKGCKNFAVLADFTEKPGAAKCGKCRLRGRNNYLRTKKGGGVVPKKESQNSTHTMLPTYKELEQEHISDFEVDQHVERDLERILGPSPTDILVGTIEPDETPYFSQSEESGKEVLSFDNSSGYSPFDFLRTQSPFPNIGSGLTCSSTYNSACNLYTNKKIDSTDMREVRPIWSDCGLASAARPPFPNSTRARVNPSENALHCINIPIFGENKENKRGGIPRHKSFALCAKPTPSHSVTQSKLLNCFKLSPFDSTETDMGGRENVSPTSSSRSIPPPDTPDCTSCTLHPTGSQLVDRCNWHANTDALLTLVRATETLDYPNIPSTLKKRKKICQSKENIHDNITRGGRERRGDDEEYYSENEDVSAVKISRVSHSSSGRGNCVGLSVRGIAVKGTQIEGGVKGEGLSSNQRTTTCDMSYSASNIMKSSPKYTIWDGDGDGDDIESNGEGKCSQHGVTSLNMSSRKSEVNDSLLPCNSTPIFRVSSGILDSRVGGSDWLEKRKGNKKDKKRKKNGGSIMDTFNVHRASSSYSVSVNISQDFQLSEKWETDVDAVEACRVVKDGQLEQVNKMGVNVRTEMEINMKSTPDFSSPHALSRHESDITRGLNAAQNNDVLPHVRHSSDDVPEIVGTTVIVRNEEEGESVVHTDVSQSLKDSNRDGTRERGKVGDVNIHGLHASRVQVQGSGGGRIYTDCTEDNERLLSMETKATSVTEIEVEKYNEEDKNCVPSDDRLSDDKHHKKLTNKSEMYSAVSKWFEHLSRMHKECSLHPLIPSTLTQTIPLVTSTTLPCTSSSSSSSSTSLLCASSNVPRTCVSTSSSSLPLTPLLSPPLFCSSTLPFGSPRIGLPTSLSSLPLLSSSFTSSSSVLSASTDSFDINTHYCEDEHLGLNSRLIPSLEEGTSSDKENSEEIFSHPNLPDFPPYVSTATPRREMKNNKPQRDKMPSSSPYKIRNTIKSSNAPFPGHTNSTNSTISINAQLDPGLLNIPESVPTNSESRHENRLFLKDPPMICSSLLALEELEQWYRKWGSVLNVER